MKKRNVSVIRYTYEYFNTHTYDLHRNLCFKINLKLKINDSADYFCLIFTHIEMLIFADEHFKSRSQ